MALPVTPMSSVEAHALFPPVPAVKLPLVPTKMKPVMIPGKELSELPSPTHASKAVPADFANQTPCSVSVIEKNPAEEIVEDGTSQNKFANEKEIDVVKVSA